MVSKGFKAFSGGFVVKKKLGDLCRILDMH